MADLTRTVLAASALLLASCGPKTLELPDEPIERAATCGSVAAAAARAGTAEVGAPLSFEAIGGVLHYPLLAGSAGETFSSDTAVAVQRRMTELQDAVVDSNWQDLVPVCAQAFPAAAAQQVTLPADRFEAQLGCDELSDFMRSALAGPEYVNELGDYRALSLELDAALGTGLRSRVGADPEAQQEERSKALATMAKAGPPVAVMRQCIERFG